MVVVLVKAIGHGAGVEMMLVMSGDVMHLEAEAEETGRGSHRSVFFLADGSHLSDEGVLGLDVDDVTDSGALARI